MPEVCVGVPSVVAAALLPALVDWGQARELMLRGHLIGTLKPCLSDCCNRWSRRQR